MKKNKNKRPVTWNTRAAQRAFDRNKRLVEAGETFRSQAPSGYRRKTKIE
jgi:hypothetical protein